MPQWRSDSARHCSGLGRQPSVARVRTMKSLPRPCILVKSMRMAGRILDPGNSGSRAVGAGATQAPLQSLAGRFHFELIGQARLAGLVVGQIFALAVRAGFVDAAGLYRSVVGILGFLALLGCGALI